MVEKSIINVRRSSICWRGRRELITDVVKTRNHGYDVIVGGELFTDYSDHPRKLVTLNPKLKSTGAGRYQLLSRWWDAYRKQLGLKDSLRKSGRCGIVQIKLRRLTVIDREDTWSGTDRCSNIWASLPALALVVVCLQGDKSIAPKKRAERSEKTMALSRVTAIILLWLSALFRRHGLLITL